MLPKMASGLPWGAAGVSPPHAWELTSSLAAHSQQANALTLISPRLPDLRSRIQPSAGPGGEKPLWATKQDQGNALT